MILQNTRPPDADPKTFPRTSDGKPDLTGIWWAGAKSFLGWNAKKTPVPLTPAYAAKRKQWEDSAAAGKPYADSGSLCIADGVPRLMGTGNFEFIVTPGKQVTIIGGMREVRRVYLDGRPQPKDLQDWELDYDGHSVGRWEGDTLVIDTIGIRANAIDPDGVWLSDHLHIVERITMNNPNGLTNEFTLTDPVALTHPWKVVQYYIRQPKTAEMENVFCTKNRNGVDANGFMTAE